jgi:DNA-binding MarR family transcriptional regulator
MSAPFEELAMVDRLVHEPGRLAILTALAACKSADFTYLQSLTGLPNGNLSQHLAKLEHGGLITIEKTIARKMPRTVLRLTPEGRRAVDQHWRHLEQMRRSARRWMSHARPEED